MSDSVQNQEQQNKQPSASNSTADPIWSSPEAKKVLKHFTDEDPIRRPILESLATLQKQHTQQQLAEDQHWIYQLIELLSQFAPHTDEILSAPRLWKELHDLNTLFIDTCCRHYWQQDISLPAVVQNPYAALIRAFEHDNMKTGGLYSIGAGQMVSILDYARQQIERRNLPPTTALLADNRAFSAVVELQLFGQRRDLLNKLWVNPSDRQPIAVHNESLRLELIQKYQPAIIFLNVKAQALTHIISQDFCNALVALPYTPILVMPSKSYTHAGKTPYETLYEQLSQYSPELAQSLTVLGGFYAAPSILTGDVVHLSVASESFVAAEKVARHLSPEVPSATGISVKHQSLTLELIQGKTEAILLMSGGANKNFLTYFAARKLLRDAFNADHTQPQQWLNAVDQHINRARQQNIDASLDIASKLLLDVNLKDLDGQLKSHSASLTTAPGLATDFIHCLPLTGQGICSIVEQAYRLQKHLLRTPARERTEVAQQELRQFITQIRQDTQRVLGTRNARDGLIDELLQYFYNSWQDHKQKIPLTLDASSFYQTFYPEQWTGEHGQEGRNGILPIVVRATLLSDLYNLEWPSLLFEAWQGYFDTPEPNLEYNKLPLLKKSGDFDHWHQKLVHLLNWAIHQGPDLAHLSMKRLLEWCNTTRAQGLQEVPRILYHLEQGLVQVELKQFSLEDLCHRIRRDCQYRERQ